MSVPTQGHADGRQEEKSPDDRLIELEIKLGFSEDLLDALNRTVYRQQQQIDLLQQAVCALRQQLQTAFPAEPRSAADDVPPHY